jgi:hypothetical protein
MPSDDIKKSTQQEWRDLGFFYHRDDRQKTWRLVGSRLGLLRFRDALLEYVDNPGNSYESEHEHYGPYLYLEIMTWHQSGFDSHSIHGSFAELRRLAAIIDAKVTVAQAGEAICIHDEFAMNSPYSMILEVREDGFDPAQADPNLW